PATRRCKCADVREFPLHRARRLATSVQICGPRRGQWIFPARSSLLREVQQSKESAPSSPASTVEPTNNPECGLSLFSNRSGPHPEFLWLWECPLRRRRSASTEEWQATPRNFV